MYIFSHLLSVFLKDLRIITIYLIDNVFYYNFAYVVGKDFTVYGFVEQSA